MDRCASKDCSSTTYYYADLVSTSIDEDLISYGLQEENTYYQYYHSYHETAGFTKSDNVRVGNKITIFHELHGLSYYSKKLYLTINDGTGELLLSGNNFQREEIAPVPLPAAAFYFIPSLFGLLFFKKRGKKIS